MLLGGDLWPPQLQHQLQRVSKVTGEKESLHPLSSVFKLLFLCLYSVYSVFLPLCWMVKFEQTFENDMSYES